MYQGDFTTANTIYVFFNTFDSNDPSASVTLTGLALTDILVYKDGSITQRASTAGFTLLDTDGIDFDGQTGIHGFSVDLSDNTDAGFYAAGSEYSLVFASVTVDAAVVNFVAATFSIERAGGVLALAKGATGFATIASDTAAIEVDTGTTLSAQVTTIASDLVLIYSDTTVIASDAVVITTDVASLSTKQDSDMVVLDASHATTLAAVGGIGSTGGAALPVEATSDNAGGAIIDSVTVLGTEAGTYANTEADDASYHVITGTATALDWVYGFTLGGGYVASALQWKGYVNSINDSMTVQAWNGSTWDTRKIIRSEERRVGKEC